MTNMPTHPPVAAAGPTGVPDLLLSEVEDDLRASVAKLLADRCEPAAVTAMYDGDRSVVRPLWDELGRKLGLAGLLVPEHRGGAGASAREVAVVLNELGRAAAPVPFLTSSVLATQVLLGAQPDGPGDDLLHALADGQQIAALLVPFTAAPGSTPVGLHMEDGRLSGRVSVVAGALEADTLLVPVATSTGTAVYAVQASAASIEPLISLDMSRQLADVGLDRAAGEELIPASAGSGAIAQGLSTAAAMLASEQAGVAQWCLATTIAYLQDRKQFGRVVGSFQALKHRLADLYVAVEMAEAAARYAAVTTATDDVDQEVAASVAQAWCSDVAVRAAEEAVQLHGGIGMTWEHPAHLYLKRAKANQLALGSPGAHRARLAVLVGLPPPAAP